MTDSWPDTLGEVVERYSSRQGTGEYATFRSFLANTLTGLLGEQTIVAYAENRLELDNHAYGADAVFATGTSVFRARVTYNDVRIDVAPGALVAVKLRASSTEYTPSVEQFAAGLVLSLNLPDSLRWEEDPGDVWMWERRGLPPETVLEIVQRWIPAAGSPQASCH